MRLWWPESGFQSGIKLLLQPCVCGGRGPFQGALLIKCRRVGLTEFMGEVDYLQVLLVMLREIEYTRAMIKKNS